MGLMTDERQSNPLRVIGTILTIVGSIWIGFFFLGGIALLDEVGLDIQALGVFGTLIPGFILLGIGRALRRRGRQREPQPAETGRPTASQRSRTPEPDKEIPRETSTPASIERREEIRTERTNVARRLEDVLAEMEDGETADERSDVSAAKRTEPLSGSPKSSEEMIAEARKRWGDDRI